MAYQADGRTNVNTTFSAIDISKLIMAILVVGIHTEPFGFNFWLDKAFGIITRLCVPFFFVSSSYLFWIKKPNPQRYILRLSILYLVWILIYLPTDNSFMGGGILNILDKLLWSGYKHLWYLNCSIIGFIIVYLLSKKLDSKAILIIAICFLIAGCIKSTWSPLFKKLLQLDIMDYGGSRNGLFYAFPYIALGKYLSEQHKQEKILEKRKAHIGFFVCIILLIIESIIFVVILKTNSTILWLSVLPLSYYFFVIILQTKFEIKNTISVLLRKTSTLTYLIHPYMILLFSNLFRYIPLFIIVSITTIILSCLIIYLSRIKAFRWLKYLY